MTDTAGFISDNPHEVTAVEKLFDFLSESPKSLTEGVDFYKSIYGKEDVEKQIHRITENGLHNYQIGDMTREPDVFLHYTGIE